MSDKHYHFHLFPVGDFAWLFIMITVLGCFAMYTESCGCGG